MTFRFSHSCFILKFCHQVSCFAFHFLSVFFPTLFAPYLCSIGNHHRYLSPCLKFYFSLSVLFCLSCVSGSCSYPCVSPIPRISSSSLACALLVFIIFKFLILFVSCILDFVLFKFGFWIFDQHITEASFLFLGSGSLFAYTLSVFIIMNVILKANVGPTMRNFLSKIPNEPGNMRTWICLIYRPLHNHSAHILLCAE